MVPRALRTLSVVTLLSTVSGTVLLFHNDGPHRGSSSGSGLAALAARSEPVSGPVADLSAGFPALNLALADARTDERQAVAQAATEVARRAAAQLKAQRQAEQAAERKAAKARAARAKIAAASRSASRDPQSTARIQLAGRGWGASQFSCLVSLWDRESGWNVRAANRSSGAYGIPQALPGSKMASAGSDWRTNAATQISWGLNYIADRYGTPCGAWGHSQATGWY